MAQTITRSTGIIPKLPWAGPLPGGGYEGRNRALDLAVQKCAKWLAKTFGRPVEIRFNSDRLSGGAFVEVMDDVAIKFGYYLDTPKAWRKLSPSDSLRKRDLWKPSEKTSMTVQIGIPVIVGMDLNKLDPKPAFRDVVWFNPKNFRDACAKLRKHVRPVGLWK